MGKCSTAVGASADVWLAGQTAVQTGRSYRSVLAVLLGGCATVFMAAPLAQSQVVVDGTTDTSVEVDAETGRTTVDIAPVFDSRISHNSYTEFNVSEAGLDLDNRLVNARTIVNEVTGSNRSAIEGDIEVLGQRAHVILANRNGITVDGGRFINTGGISLSTGEVGYLSRQVAPGIFQLNTVVETGEGDIAIEGAGLVGTMDRLDLLSKTLRVAGAVSNDSEDARAEVRLYAGASIAEYDSAIVPTNTASQWGRVLAGDADGVVEAVEPVVVDVTRMGGLSASRIYIEVTDLGAGVRYAGDGLAARRDFTLLNNGQLVFDGADITAATDIALIASAITSTGDVAEARRTTLSAAFGSTNLTARDGDVDLTDTRITGFSGFEPAGILGAVNIEAAGAIRIASTSDALRSDLISFAREDIDVRGDIVLNAATDIDIADTVISAAGDIWLSADAIEIASDVTRAVLVAEGGLSAEALSGDIVNQGGLLQALGQLADTDADAGAGDESVTEPDADADADTTADAGTANLTLRAAGDIVNRSIDAESLGILFSDTSIRLDADGIVRNDTARIISNGEVDLVAGEAVEAVIAYADGFDASRGSLIDTLSEQLKASRSEQAFDFGALAVGGELSIISAGTDLSIDAPRLLNRGAEISANDGTLSIAADAITLESVYSGDYAFSRSCFIFCSSSGHSSVQARGGRLISAGDIVISDAQSLDVIGGDVIALGDLSVDADAIVLEAAPIPTLISRPSGLYNFWAGTTAFILWQDRFGTLSAGGQLLIETDGAVELRGGQLLGEDIVNPAGERIVRLPTDLNPLERDRLGILNGGF